MTPERFRQIIAAYGAEPQRWPDVERNAAQAFVSGNSEAQAMLEQEASLDRVLGAYRVAPAGSALVGAIVASARPRRRLSWTLIGKGLGLAGAGLAGAVAGAFLMMAHAPSVPVTDDDDGPILTSFDVVVSDYDPGEMQ